MANQPDYSCTRCGATPGRDKLFVKRVQFTTMGAGARVIKSRVKGWFCGSCVTKDSDYTQEAQPGVAPQAVQVG